MTYSAIDGDISDSIEGQADQTRATRVALGNRLKGRQGCNDGPDGASQSH
jgi:hypothetical protein